MHSDQKYIVALIQNDGLLLEEMFEKYTPRIRSMILANGGNEVDAADIFQETLLAIYNRALKGFELTCPFEAFIYIACKNRWINETVKRKNSKVTFTDTLGSEIGDDVFKNEEELRRGEARRELFEQKIQELGDPCKKLLQLAWSGKPLQEVATLMQTTYGYIRKRKSECMGKLTLLVQRSPEFERLK